MASNMKRGTSPFSLGSMVGDVGALLGTAFHDLVSIISVVDHTPIVSAILHLVSSVFNHADKGVINIIKRPGNPESWFSEATTSLGTPFVDAFMVGGLGANPDFTANVADGMKRKPPHEWVKNAEPFRVDTRPGLNALARMVGFILTTNLAFAGIGTVAKLILAQRHHERIDTMLGTVGEQLGLGWASGTALSGLFETAMLPPLEESINVQFHPRRLDMMILRQLARQHHITMDEFWAGLDLQGYPDYLKALIVKMDSNALQPQDLQALWSLGLMSRDQVKTYMQGVGFSDQDIEYHLAIWIDHAETQELGQYRAEVRAAYLESKISRDQFKDALAELLTAPHTPSNPPWLGNSDYTKAPDQVKIIIDTAVANADFAKEWGRTQLSIAQVSKLYKAGDITRSEAVHRLLAMGHSQADADRAIEAIELGALAGKPAMSSAKILSYVHNGVLTNQQGYERLLNMGMDGKDAEFLAWNPQAKAGNWLPAFTPATIIQAYIDGTLSVDEVAPKLMQAGLNETEAKLEIERAYHQIYYGLHPAQMTTKEEEHWRDEWKASLKAIYLAGGIGDQEAVNLLLEAGLSQADAGIIWAGWYVAKNGHMPTAPVAPTKPTGGA